MRIIEIQIFTFDELSEKAKQKAIDYFAQTLDYPWHSENEESLKFFKHHFGVTDKPDNLHFRGLKLKDFDPDYMPTGHGIDWDLWNTFYKEFKRTGSALLAYNDAIQTFEIAVERDIADYCSEEQIVEMILCNGYEFTIDGKLV